MILKNGGACFVLLVFMAAFVPAAAASPADVRIHGDLMDVRLENVPLRAALADIGRKAQINVFVQKGLYGTVSARFQNVTIEDGLKRLLDDYSSSLVFTKAETGPSAGKTVVTEIKVFRKGDAAAGSIENFEMLGNRPAAQAYASSNAGHTAGPILPRTGEAVGGPGGTAAAFDPEGMRSGDQMMSVAVIKSERFAIQRLQKEIISLRQSLNDIEDGREKAKTRTILAAKSAELKEREMLLQHRVRGLARMQRQMAVQP